MLLALLALLPPLTLPVQTRTLSNGLTVLISVDHSAPGVAVDLRFHVGSKDEDPGRTGFAHLFEHLMFMGARHVPYPKFDTIMEAAGGNNNAFTNNDVTNYYEEGPKNLLETFLWMEGDRLATLGISMTQEKLETQRKVVLNERRQSYENRPYGQAYLELEEHLFGEGHPYHWPVIGSAKDLEAAQLQDVTRFFATWYVPANAVLAIVGDVEPSEAFAAAQKYLGWIESPPLPERKAVKPLPLAKNEKLQLTDKVELPRLLLAWQSPKTGTQGDAECDLLAKILGHGKASRLYERLVHKDGIAAEVSAEQASREAQGSFDIDVQAAPGHTLAEVLAAVDDELTKIVAKGPSQPELDASRTGLYTEAARDLEGLVPRAIRLTAYQFDYGAADSLHRDLQRYEAATPESVRKTAAEVLKAPRVIIEVTPAPAAAAAVRQ
ncbi:MAG TPA: pitrilysin family protein [Myxococcales bacterium]|nr:pitrilysin family protein [Myxococcales bacterium]